MLSKILGYSHRVVSRETLSYLFQSKIGLTTG